jgi:hypothetical protein
MALASGTNRKDLPRATLALSGCDRSIGLRAMPQYLLTDKMQRRNLAIRIYETCLAITPETNRLTRICLMNYPTANRLGTPVSEYDKMFVRFRNNTNSKAGLNVFKDHDCT